MEQVLAGLAPHRKSSRTVRTGLKSALHCLADAQVFILNPSSHGDTLLVVCAARIAHIAEVEVEDHPAAIHVDRQHQVRIHVAFVAVDHQVGILPEIPSAVPSARGAGCRILLRCHHRARLEAVPVLDLDGVLLVVENAVQAFVEMRNVISAVEVIIDEHLPVAMNVVHPTIKMMQLTDAQGRDTLHQSSEKLRQGHGLSVQIHEYEFLPRLSLHRHQAILLPFEIFHSIELRHSLQRSVQTIVPAVIRTMQDRSLPAGFRNHCSRVMTAHVEERPQHPIVDAHHHDGLSGHVRGHELSGLLHLLHPADHLPGLAENRPSFEFRNARVHIPRSRNSRSFRQGCILVVNRQYLPHRNSHAHLVRPYSAGVRAPPDASQLPVPHPRRSAPIALFSTSRNWPILASFLPWGSPCRRKSPGSSSSTSRASWKRSTIQSMMETITSTSRSLRSSPRSRPKRTKATRP